jgi:sugar-specific transcriptional regulator TrmB
VLRALGLSPAEQALYELLLTLPPTTGEALRELSAALWELPADRVWAGTVGVALRRLEELGLVTRLPDTPPRYVVVPVGAGLEALIAARERSLVTARQRMDQLAVRYRQRMADEDPLNLVEVVHGREAVQERLQDLFRSVRTEMRAIDAPPYIGDPLVTSDEELDHLREGVRYRIIYDRQAVNLPGRLPEIRDSVVAGEEARVTDVALKLGLSDHPLAMLPLRSHPVDLETWLVVHDSALLDALSALFEMYWERAVPLNIKEERPDMAGHDAPNEIDRALLSLLAAGLTDKAVAEHLGCHERTAHRHLREMMHRLDAVTRFQAGYQAVRRGWLTDPGSDIDGAR